MGERADKLCVCKECKGQFTFTAAEQEQYAGRGRYHAPGRCPECREARAGRKPDQQAAAASHAVTCAKCGVRTRVPFVPRSEKPVYCRECFVEMRRK